MKKTVVLYPGLAISHFTPMMQLADVLREEGYDVAVALIDVTMEHNTAFAAAVDRAIASSKSKPPPPPALTFHTLPRIHDPPTVTNDVNLLLGYFEIIRRYNEHLRDFLCSIAPPRRVEAVIVDSFSNAALDVTNELGIPAYSFFASNASALAVFLQLPYWAHRAEGQPSFKELGDATVSFHGVPSMPASHLVREVLEDPKTEIYKAVMNSMGKNLEAAGILVNTFASLEPQAVASFKDPDFLAAESELKVPPVYCVGPLVEDAATETTTKEKHECLEWLDEQPEHSVVFLCFGSLGNHSETQLKEIAGGLERSGHRFLWVVRAPLGDNPERKFDYKTDLDLHTLLPEGFLERTRGRGVVVKLWAPQVEVLRHKATGAFVTHCGWNSVLEGIMAGVPMLCWPLYAEQKMNKVVMVEEIGIGVELVGWQHGLLVKAEELEAKVRLVMESDEGVRLIRARVTAHKEAAEMVWKDGGSSRMAFRQFVSDMGKVTPDLTLG